MLISRKEGGGERVVSKAKKEKRFFLRGGRI